ncbi:hypothetical protein P3S68_032275 [Capsicum galapagoense]
MHFWSIRHGWGNIFGEFEHHRFLYITSPGFTFSFLMCDISQSSSGFLISVRLKAMCMAYGRACDVLRTRLPDILRDTTFSSCLSED